MQIDLNKSYRVAMTTSCGEISLELFDDKSPKTVNNFLFLVKKGFYDGTTFHRIIKGFMNQGGDPEGTGRGGPGYQFEDEVDNGLKFDQVGLLAMANSGPNTNGSQFFITTGDASHLNGKHTIFGKVIGGMEVVEALNALETDQNDKPTQTAYIETITIIGPPGSFISPGGAMNFYVGGPLFVVFFLALGIALSLEQQPGEAPATVGDEPDAGPSD